MDTSKMHVYKFFLPWQDEAEEAWLREMSQHGWRLAKADLFGSFIFAAGEPRDDVYRLDFRIGTKKELQDYYQLIHDAGWELVSELGAWKYFCKPAASSGSDELFSDANSKAGKYRRFMVFLVIPLLGLIDWLLLYPNLNDLNRYPALLTVFYILHAVIGFMLIGVLLRIRKLKRTRNGIKSQARL